jgi:hypothetical protein
MSTAPDPPFDMAELRLLAQREEKAADKREYRERQAWAKALAVVTPNASGFQVPAGLSAIRKWVRGCHDAYSRRLIGPTELTEVRRSAGSLAKLQG